LEIVSKHAHNVSHGNRTKMNAFVVTSHIFLHKVLPGNNREFEFGEKDNRML